MGLSHYTKWRRVFWSMFLLNAGVALLQLGFAYDHIAKHEYWWMTVSLALGAFNGVIAWSQVKNLRKLKQDQRRAVIDILSTKYQGVK